MGIIGFGGGAALIPVIENELVVKKKWIEKERFDFYVAISSISPASLPVALCSIWSNKYSLLSAYSYALPGSLLFLVLMTGFSLIGESGLIYIGFASVGIISFILLIIYSFIRRSYEQGKKIGINKQFIIIIATSFFLTSGNVIRRLMSTLFILDMDHVPNSFFSLSMIDLIIMIFFIIFFIGGSTSKYVKGIAIIIPVFYALSRGRIDIFNEWDFVLIVTMIVLVIASVFYDFAYKKNNRSNRRAFKLDYKPLRNLFLFLLFSIVLTIIAFLITGGERTWELAFRVILSSLISFGGGEAYIGVADAIFIQTGFISAKIFYSQIVGMSSAMPGPVLMSIAAGIGFTYGISLGDGVLFGWVYGLLSIALAVSATAFGAIILFTCFEIFKDSLRLHMIVRYIIPIICGVLISIALSLLYQASSVLIREGISPWLSTGLIVLIFFVLMVCKKHQVNDMALLLMGGVGTLMSMIIIL